MKTLNNVIKSENLYLWQVLLLTFGYMLLQAILSIGFYEITISFTDDPFMQIEVAEFLSIGSISILVFFFFRKTIYTKDAPQLPFPNGKVLLYLLILIVSLRLFEDPFFRYKHIIFGKPYRDISKISEIHFSIGLLIKGIYMIIIIPIIEEFFFRKIIFKSLLKRYSSLWLSIMISSILFSLIHLSIRNAIPALIFGIISAYLYFKTANIWYSVFFHVGYNMLWFIIYINPKPYWNIYKNLNLGLGYWVLIAFGISLIYLIINKIKKIRIS